MQMNTLKRILHSPLFHILIGLIAGLYSRYYIDFIYEKMRGGGLTPALPFVHTNADGVPAHTDVYIIPLEGLHVDVAASLAKFLSGYFNINVRETAMMPLPREAYDTSRKQYLGNMLYEPIKEYLPNIPSKTTNTIFIAILAGDMYPYGSSWNYTLQLGFDNNISIVATDRLVPYGITDQNQAQAIYGQRLCKMLVRVILERYYGQARSNDPASLLFSPIMSIDDIDRMILPSKSI